MLENFLCFGKNKTTWQTIRLVLPCKKKKYTYILYILRRYCRSPLDKFFYISVSSFLSFVILSKYLFTGFFIHSLQIAASMFTKNTCTKWKNCAWVQPRRQRLPRPLPRERKRPIRKDFLASAGYFLKGSCPAIVNPVCKVMSDSNSSHHWLLVAFKQRKEKKRKEKI